MLLPVKCIHKYITAHAGRGCVELDTQRGGCAIEVCGQRVPEVSPGAGRQRRLVGIEPVAARLANEELGVDHRLLVGGVDIGMDQLAGFRRIW